MVVAVVPEQREHSRQRSKQQWPFDSIANAF